MEPLLYVSIMTSVPSLPHQLIYLLVLSEQPCLFSAFIPVSSKVFIYSLGSIIPGRLRGAQLGTSSSHFLQRVITMPTVR